MHIWHYWVLQGYPELMASNFDHVCCHSQWRKHKLPGPDAPEIRQILVMCMQHPHHQIIIQSCVRALAVCVQLVHLDCGVNSHSWGQRRMSLF